MSDASDTRPGQPGPLRAMPAPTAWLRPGRLRLPAHRSLLLYALMPGLSAVNAAVGLLLPILFGPSEFGRYSIAVTLFQYALICDLGVSQLIDRSVPGLMAPGRGAELRSFVAAALWIRLYVAGAVLLLGLSGLAVAAGAGVLPFDFPSGALSLLAGLLYMVALGPPAVYRATSRHREFALAGAAGMVVLAVARPAGILIGGRIGCFAALTLCYLALAICLQRQMPLRIPDRPGAAQTARLLARGAPLFITSFVWAFYMTANRWVVSFLAPQVELGHFAFASNNVYLIVGAIGALSQFYYPKVATRFAQDGMQAVSGRLAQDLSLLAALVALPTGFGILVGPTLIDVFYPKFSGSGDAVRLLLVSVPSLTVASWLMPLALSTASRPWVDGLLIYPASLLLLMAGTAVGYWTGGISGAACGMVISALPLLAMQMARLHSVRLISWRHAAVVLCATYAITALLLASAL